MVIFRDAAAPTPNCITTSPMLEILQDSTITLFAQDFDNGSADNCSPDGGLFYSIVGAGQTPLTPLDVGFGSQSSVELTCENLSLFSTLEFWVWDQNGNGDFCEVDLVFTTDCEIDIDEVANISGSAKTPEGVELDNVAVTITAGATIPGYPNTSTTDLIGDYAFANNPLNVNYQLTATKEDEASNGISTLDMVLLQRHILGITLLEDPYKRLAGDANCDGALSAVDLVGMRQVILGLLQEFPGDCPTWKLVQDLPLDIDGNVAGTPNIDVLNLMESLDTLDFIGVKTGDLNSSVDLTNALFVEKRSDETLLLEIENRLVSEDEIIKVEVLANQFSDIFGFQFTLAHNGLEFLGIESGGIEISDQNLVDINHVLSISWSEALTTNARGKLFTLHFRAEDDVELIKAIEIKKDGLRAEAYQGKDLLVMGLDLAFINSDSNATLMTLYQNTPNPFNAKTQIDFEIPYAGEVDFKIIDLTGKVIYNQTNGYAKGLHTLPYEASSEISKGLYYYSITFDGETQTKKMLVIE